MLGTVTPESKAAEPRGCCSFRGNFGIQSCLLGVHRVGADDLLRCPFFRELLSWLWSTCKVSCPANPGGIGSIHFCLRSVSAWLGLAQRNPMCVHEGMNIKPSSLPFSCILTSLLSVSKDIFASAHRCTGVIFGDEQALLLLHQL